MAIGVDDLKKLSPKVKALIVCLLYLLLAYLYFMFYLQGALEKHGGLSAKLTELRQQMTQKEKAVAELDKYKREVGVLKESFGQAVMMLPNQKEIPDLLLAVTNAGRNAGVDFLLFEPKLQEKPPSPGNPAAPGAKPADGKAQPQKPAEQEKFYQDILIKVQLAGGFHNTLSFFEQVARLPRIVNIEDISMGMVDPKDTKAKGRVLKTACTVKTYMFVGKK